MATPKLGRQFDAALEYASHLHSEQTRKGTEIPYVSHLMATASLALEHGANEDEAIAALLHDAIEDHPRDGATDREIGAKFGPAVLAIVRGCTDADVLPKPPWRARKEAYLAHLEQASPSTLLVSASDKLHNLRAILSDYRAIGEKLWSRFNKDADSLWYYGALVETYEKSVAPRRLVEELRRTFAELEGLCRRTVSN